MTALPSQHFSDDLPLTAAEDDKLNRRPFAQRISRILQDVPAGGGLVLGLHGPWGDGKTSLMNMIRADLAGAKSDPIIVEYNPWRFTSDAAMLTGFFSSLATAINAKLKTNKENLAQLASKFAKYASIVDPRFATAGELADSKAETDLEELHARLSDALMKEGRRIVVFVDDIDRLDRDEVHTLFRIIKACASFPNVCYLLVFDDGVVAQALGARYGDEGAASGRAFLEKMIQVRLQLPPAAKEDLRSICFEEIEAVLSTSGVELSQEEIGQFVSGFDRGAAIRLDTPRAAKRYANGVRFALPMLLGEVNVVDLLLLEALRAFYPEVYDCVRAHQDDAAGAESSARPQPMGGSRLDRALEPALEQMETDTRRAVQALLGELFPRMGSPKYGPMWLSTWEQDRRVCSPSYCSRYFSYAIPPNDVADAKIASLLETAGSGNYQEVEKSLSHYLEEGRARRLIERLRSREGSIDPEAARVLCLALPGLAKLLPNPRALFFHVETPSQAGILISHLIARLPEGSDRVELAKQVMEKADPLWFGDECLRWMYVTDEEHKAHANALTKAEMSEVRQTLVKRVKARAADGGLLFDPETPQEKSLLFEWWRAEGREPVQKHLSAVFAKDLANLPLFLQAMAPAMWGQNAVLPRMGKIDGDQLKNIKLIFDLDELAALVRQLLPEDLDEPREFPPQSAPLAQRLAEQFMFVYNEWREHGEPPDRNGADDDAQSVGGDTMAGDPGDEPDQ